MTSNPVQPVATTAYNREVLPFDKHVTTQSLIQKYVDGHTRVIVEYMLFDAREDDDDEHENNTKPTPLTGEVWNYTFTTEQAADQFLRDKMVTMVNSLRFEGCDLDSFYLKDDNDDDADNENNNNKKESRCWYEALEGIFEGVKFLVDAVKSDPTTTKNISMLSLRNPTIDVDELYDALAPILQTRFVFHKHLVFIERTPTNITTM
jgi:hypothetical protein